MKLKIEQISRSISEEEVEEIVSEVIDRSYALDDKDQQFEIIKSLVGKLDDVLDYNSKKNVMQEQGKFCFYQRTDNLVKNLVEKSKSFADYIDRLNKSDFVGSLKIENKKIHITVNKCLCPAIKDTKDNISKTYCFCSSGWYKELFESYLGENTVELELVETIAGGANKCYHIAHLKETIL